MEITFDISPVIVNMKFKITYNIVEINKNDMISYSKIFRAAISIPIMCRENSGKYLNYKLPRGFIKINDK